MPLTVKRKVARLKAQVDTLSLSKTEIARRYGCSRQFIHNALTGRSMMPRRLRNLLIGMIAEKTAQIADVIPNVHRNGDHRP